MEKIDMVAAEKLLSQGVLGGAVALMSKFLCHQAPSWTAAKCDELLGATRYPGDASVLALKEAAVAAAAGLSVEAYRESIAAAAAAPASAAVQQIRAQQQAAQAEVMEIAEGSSL